MPEATDVSQLYEVGNRKFFAAELLATGLFGAKSYHEGMMELKLEFSQEVTEINADDNHAFSTMIRCGECNELFRRHAQSYNGVTDRTWACKTRIGDKTKCSTKPLKETDIESAFVRALNRLITDRDAVIAEIMSAAAEVITDQDKADYDRKIEELNQAREEMLELNRPANRRTEGYRERINIVMQRIGTLMAETKFISELIDTKKLAKHRLDDIRAALEKDMLEKFDAGIFKQLVNGIRVLSDRELEFEFICGITTKEKA